MASAVRVLQVCEALAEHQPVGVRELARAVASPPSSVHRALETLRSAGWATANADGVWMLTSRCAFVAAHAGAAGALRVLARPAMARLLAVSDESVRLWALEGDHVVLAENFDGRQPVRYVSPPAGTTLPLHASSAGKAILAYLPAAEQDAFLLRPLDATTAHTITDPEALRHDLAATRARGWSETFHEARLDVGGVAAPVLDATGRPVAALSVSLPMHRLTEAVVREYGARVAHEAALLTAEFSGA
jgi:IclR family transcriptional regulator, acetate operon repressor